MEITVKQLIEQLKIYDDNMVLFFGGLDFYRLKHRGKDPETGVEILQMEFNQLVYPDDQGKIQIVNTD